MDSRFRLIPAAEVALLPPTTWLVDDLIQDGGVTLLVGPPNSYKTFLALHLALAIASAQPQVLGRAARAGRVVYVSAEGQLAERQRAWYGAHGVADAACWYLHRPLPLQDATAISALLAAVAEAEAAPPVLFVFDTLAKCIAGVEENSAKEMGVVAQNLDELRRQTGAAILLVHHVARHTERARGSTALGGAVDTELSLTREDGGQGVVLAVQKQRNGVYAPPLRLVPRVVAAEDGGSLVLDLDHAPVAQDARLLALLAQTPAGLATAAWQARAEQAGISGGSFDRMKARLVAANAVVAEGKGRWRTYRIASIDAA